MAIKANASSTGGGEFKQYIGVGSFRVLGVNPTKEELSKFYGRDVQNDPQYITDKTDDEGKPYKSMRITFMLQADPTYEDGKPNKTNAALTEPLKTTVSFFIENRYEFNKDKTKIHVEDTYGRTAWVPVEQAKNHQIPVYKNGPARLDKNYKPLLRGEEELTQFILNYLNTTPIDTYNKNTGEWITNPNPADCEGQQLDKIQNYFKNDISELKEYCKLIPTNRVKVLLGVRTDNEGRQHGAAYTRITLRNGSNSYTILKDDIENRKSMGALKDTIFSDDPVGMITNIHEYNVNVKETDLSKPAPVEDPFAAGAALPDDDLPFSDSAPSDDPFADVA